METSLDTLTSLGIARMARRGAFDDVADERVAQDLKWGEQNHDPFVWLGILMEEVGEAAQAALRSNFGPGDKYVDNLRDYRKEMVQVAAVAMAAIECFDRNTWEWRE